MIAHLPVSLITQNATHLLHSTESGTPGCASHSICVFTGSQTAHDLIAVIFIYIIAVKPTQLCTYKYIHVLISSVPTIQRHLTSYKHGLK